MRVPFRGIESLESRRLFAAVTADIDFGQTHQTMEGFGAAMINWLSPAQLPELDDASFYDMLVNDLGASAIRGAVHPNFENVNDDADPNTFNWAGFDKQAMANTFTTFQRMKERGATTFLLSVWSPPFWQKTNYATLGGGFLRPDMRAEFAEWVAAAVIVAKQDYGIDITAVSVQNEQFFHAWYEATLYDNIQMRETVLALQKKFEAENLPTKILANEDLGLNDPHRWKWYNEPLLADPQIDRKRLIIGSHYTGVPTMAAQADQLAGTGLPLWYTEVSGKLGSWEQSMATAVEMLEAVTRANASAYFYWQYTNTDNSDWDFGSSLIHEGVPSNKYHAVKHLYKYIRPGMQRVTGTESDSLTSLGAFRDPTSGASTIAIINSALTATDYTLNLSNFAPGTTFRVWQSTDAAKWTQVSDIAASASMTITLPSRSMVTLYSGPDIAPVTGLGTWVAPPWQYKEPIQRSNLLYRAYIGTLAELQTVLQTTDINYADPATGWTALHAAAASPYGGRTEIIQYLIANGANVNAVANNGFTPLHAVASNAWYKWEPALQPLLDRAVNHINMLVDAGANVNAKDALGRTPLHWSVTVPVMYTEYTYYTNVLTTLVDRGADLAALDNQGLSAYDLATSDYRLTYSQQLALEGPVINTTRPFVRYSAYDVDANVIHITTSENTTFTFADTDITITNLDTNTPVTGWAFEDAFNYGITIAKVSFASRLPDGHYRLSVPANAITDLRGLSLAAPIVVEFNVLRGDATNDGVVNFDDLLVVAQNYGKSGRTWSQGDFNGDGIVNFDDLLVTAQHYAVPPPPIMNDRKTSTGRAAANVRI